MNQPAPRRPLWVDLTLLALCGAIFVVLVMLGNWQIRRLHWKTDLIEAVETRAFAPAVAPPREGATFADNVYQRVVVNGQFRHDLTLKVKAVTGLGPGDWIMTPLATEDGIIWINRGYAPAETGPEDWALPEGPQEVEGLLRVSEPDGTLLESNDPEAGRWVSRDIAAMSAAVGLDAAPLYFIDADRDADPAVLPRGGMTVIHFRNSHLSYALTWYGMALLFLIGMGIVVRGRLKGQH